MEGINCKIISCLECDILYQATYVHKCDNCGYEGKDERKACSILKSGTTLDTDNFICPNCGCVCQVNFKI